MTDADRFIPAILARAATARTIVAIAGAPGSGKSTLVERLRDRLLAEGAAGCEILAMDGFHYDDTLLEPWGWRPRKGAPHTFDVGGLAATLLRLRAGQDDVAVPVFDRAIEIARAGARIIPASARVILAEGNYLLLDTAPWSDLAPAFDVTALIDCPPEVIRGRLTGRWRKQGFSEEKARAWIESNDLPNAMTVITGSRTPDHRLPCGWDPYTAST